MKRLIVILTIFLLFSCAARESQLRPEQSIDTKSPQPIHIQKKEDHVIVDQTKVETNQPILKESDKNLQQELIIPTNQKETKQSTGQPIFEEIKLPSYEPKRQLKPLPPPPPPQEKPTIDPKSVIKIKNKVLVNTDGMPLSEFIIYVIGETLKVTFFMEEEVMKNKTPITLKMETPIEPEKLLEAVIGILEKRGILVEERAGSLYLGVQKQPQPAQKKPLDIRIGGELPDSTSEIIFIYPLHYIHANIIESMVRDYFKTGVNIRLYPRDNALMIQGQVNSIKEVIDFIKIFDVPFIQGKKVILLNLTYWQPDEFQKQLTTILDGLGIPIARSPRDVGVFFIPIKYLNSLIVISPDEKTQSFVLEWARRLDTAESAGAEEKAFIYTPKYSKASDLVESLRNIYAAIDPRASSSPQPSQPQPPQQRVPTVTARGFATTGLKVAADDKRNLLLIMTTPAQYKNILTYLEKLDLPPKQVLIEAMIAELTLADDLKYGFEWLLKNKMIEGAYTLSATFGVPSSPGLTYTFLSDSQRVRVLINALATKDLVNILSSPRLMVLDNDEATIQVGTDVPVITGQVTSAEAAGQQTGVVQTIQYRSTGIILRVKPTVNTEGLLNIKISQEVSEMGSNPPGISSPTILVRKIDTSVVASSGESIILGGLMSQTESSSESKVPFIGDIPLIGEFFKSRTKEQRKTELIVILTPRIISTIQEASKLTDQFKRELKWFEGNIGGSLSK